MHLLKCLSDKELLNQLKSLVTQEQELTLNILPHLAEVERRELYLEKAYSSLYDYCRSEFGYSDASAWRRSSAAVAILKCPEAWELLKQKRVTMSVLCQIHKIITPKLLKQVCGKSKSEVEYIIAALRPQSANPDRSRPVMVPKVLPPERLPQRAVDEPEDTGAPAMDESNIALRSEVDLTNVKLSFEQKWKIEGVVSKRVHDKLERCKKLLSRKYPGGVCYDKLFDELTEVYLSKADPERRASNNKKTRSSKARPSSRHTRHIPLIIKAKVWKRDNGRCTFVGSNGKRCNSEFNLQYDHYPVPYARGGPSTVDNLRLLCAKHNRQTAEKTYSKPHVENFCLKEESVIYEHRKSVLKIAHSTNYH